MAFADSIRTASATFELVASLMESQLVEYDYDAVVAGISTTSTTMVDYTDISITKTSTAGQTLIAWASVTLSHGTTLTNIDVQLVLDGTLMTNSQLARYHSTRANTGGRDITQHVFGVVEPSAGSHTIKLQWSTDAGTAYSSQANLHLLSLRNS